MKIFVVSVLLAATVAGCSGGSSKPALRKNAAPVGAAAGSALAAQANFNLGDAGEEAAKWIAEKIGGGIIGGAAGKGFNEVLALIAGDKTSAALDEIKAKLDQIKQQLDQLQNTMNQALQEIVKTEYAVLAQRVQDLRDRVLGAQRDFQEALSYAGQADKKQVMDQRIASVEDKVNTSGGLADRYPVVPESIIPGMFAPKPLYQALSNVVTRANTKKFFTWRDSAAIDNVFQYLLYLQALQFNLIAQVRTKEGSAPDQIYEGFGKPFLGDKASFQEFLDKKVPTPTSGSLHDELAMRLKQVPGGALIQMQGNQMWSFDVQGGARESLSVPPSGPGSPVCTGSGFKSRVTCLDDPSAKVGSDPGSPASQLAANLARAGLGAADQWNLPAMGQMTSLLAGWTPQQGPAKAWLEAQAGSDPAKCKPVKPGTGEAVSDPNTCFWPAGTYWSDDFSFSEQHIDWKPPQQALISDVRVYTSGWTARFFNISDSSQPQCSLSATKLDWNDLDGLDYQFRPQGKSMDLQSAPACGGAMSLVRAVPAGEQYYFPL